MAVPVTVTQLMMLRPMKIPRLSQEAEMAGHM
jgi:hypothetical protein